MDIMRKNDWVKEVRFVLRFFRVRRWSMFVVRPMLRAPRPPDGDPPDWLEAGREETEVHIVLTGFFRKRQYRMPAPKEDQQ